MSQTETAYNESNIPQSYQQVCSEVRYELLKLQGQKLNLQEYFFNLSQKEPARFQRLFFDRNGHAPFSEDLESILFDLKISENKENKRR